MAANTVLHINRGSKLLSTYGSYRCLLRLASTGLIKDKAYVNGEWVSAKNGSMFNGIGLYITFA